MGLFAMMFDAQLIYHRVVVVFLGASQHDARTASRVLNVIGERAMSIRVPRPHSISESP
jgi:hypothetical protein